MVRRAVSGELLFEFSVYSTAVFAEPAITKIEEVVCLVHPSGDQRSRRLGT
jgi:hypothetical protein